MISLLQKGLHVLQTTTEHVFHDNLQYILLVWHYSCNTAQIYTGSF